MVPLWCGQYSKKKYLQKTPHSSPIGVKYGVSFVGSVSDWYTALVPAMMYTVSFYIGARYNGNILFMKCTFYGIMLWTQWNLLITCSLITQYQIYGLVQDCSISSALAMEILQCCTKPSIYTMTMTSAGKGSNNFGTFLQNTHKGHIIPHPHGQAIQCLLYVLQRRNDHVWL